MNNSHSLQEILKEVLRKYYRSQRALAKDLDMSESRLGKVLVGKGESFTIDRCLKLAKIAGLQPSTVLHAAGKPEAAALIEELYGEERKASPRPAFSDRQKELLEHFDALGNDAHGIERQQKFIGVLRDLREITIGVKPTRRGRKSK